MCLVVRVLPELVVETIERCKQFRGIEFPCHSCFRLAKISDVELDLLANFLPPLMNSNTAIENTMAESKFGEKNRIHVRAIQATIIIFGGHRISNIQLLVLCRLQTFIYILAHLKRTNKRRCTHNATPKCAHGENKHRGMCLYQDVNQMHLFIFIKYISLNTWRLLTLILIY